MKEAGSLGWHVISIDNIEKFAAIFEIVELPSNESKTAMVAEIEKRIGQQSFKEASVLIRTFDLYESLELDQLHNTLKSLIKTDKVDDALNFIRDSAELAKVALKSMEPVKHAKIARELIKKFGFDPYEYHEIAKAQIYFAVSAFVLNLGWMITEEKVSNFTKLEKLCFLEILVKKEMFSEALGVAKRHGLEFPEELKEAVDKESTLTPKANVLWEKDEFGPIEVYLQNAKKEKYLTLEDLGVKESDVIFLSSIDQVFEHTTKTLLDAKKVGVDAEFASDLLGYAPMTIAILQLATVNMVVIIDFVALQHTEDLYDFCVKLFGDSNIEKIGHSFSTDTKCLKSSFKDRPMEFKNITNIEQDYLGANKPSLGTIVKQEFGKEMSKYNQQSNWRQRPLRKSQIHYAALDAVATLQVYLKKLNEDSSTQETAKSEITMVAAPKKEIVRKTDAELLSAYRGKKDLKFVVDGMLKKLAHNLRNIGLDAVFTPEAMKPKEIVALAEAEDRIMLTRDKKLMDCKRTKPLIKITDSDPFDQLKEVIKILEIEVTKESLLSRCVKCNTKDLQLIDFEEAQKSLKWENEEDNTINEFWRCSACMQIYWEGGTFDRAKKMFSSLINSYEIIEGHQPGLREDEIEGENGENETEGTTSEYLKEEIGMVAEKEPIDEAVLKEIDRLM